MSLNQQVIAEFSPCTPCAPQLRDLSIQTFRRGGSLSIVSERLGDLAFVKCVESIGSENRIQDSCPVSDSRSEAMRVLQIDLLLHGIGIGCRRYDIAGNVRSR